MAEVLLKKSTKTVRDMEAVIKDLVAKMPEETILSQ